MSGMSILRQGSRLRCYGSGLAPAALIAAALIAATLFSYGRMQSLLSAVFGATPAAAEVEGGLAGTGHSVGDSGLGGTGRAGDESGLGGTGHGPGETGIGGTGFGGDDDAGIGGTGFVGTITGFGSILVNGAKIGYDDSTPLSVDGSPASIDSLALGHVVLVEAESRDGALTARSISVSNSVSGSVSAVDEKEGFIVVAGQTVLVASGDESRAVLRAGDEKLTPGLYVTVSGLRRSDGYIEAGRVDVVEGSNRVRVVGPAASLDDGGFSIAALRVEAGQEAPARASGLAAGAVVVVEGSLVDGVLHAATIDEVPLDPFGGRVSRLSVEGFATRDPSGEFLQVGTWRVDMSDALREATGLGAMAPDTRVRVEGVLEAPGRIRARMVSGVLRRPALLGDRPVPDHGPAPVEESPTAGRNAERARPDDAVPAPDMAAPAPDAAGRTPDMPVAGPDMPAPAPEVAVPAPDMAVPAPRPPTHLPVHERRPPRPDLPGRVLRPQQPLRPHPLPDRPPPPPPPPPPRP